MAIHYDKKSGRFKDDNGRFVSKDKAMRSSIARREYESATKQHAPRVEAGAIQQRKRQVPAKAGPKPAPRKRTEKVSHAKPVRPVVAKKAPPRKAKPASKKPAPVRVPKQAAAPKAVRPPKAVAPSRPRDEERAYPPHVGDQEGIVEEFPLDWFPDPGSEDDFDWQDIEDLWGDYEDADTTSAGPDNGGES